MAKNNFIKKNYKRAESFLKHLPLFARYLTIITSLILVSYLVLTTALAVFLTNHWTHQKEELLIENVTLNAEFFLLLLPWCFSDERWVMKDVILGYKPAVAVSLSNTASPASFSILFRFRTSFRRIAYVSSAPLERGAETGVNSPAASHHTRSMRDSRLSGFFSWNAAVMRFCQ